MFWYPVLISCLLLVKRRCELNPYKRIPSRLTFFSSSTSFSWLFKILATMLAHSLCPCLTPCPRSSKICGTPYQIPPCAEIDNHPDAIHLISVPGDLRLEGKVQEGRAGRGLGRRSPAPIDLLFRDRLRYQFLEQASGLVSRTPYSYCLVISFFFFLFVVAGRRRRVCFLWNALDGRANQK